MHQFIKSTKFKIVAFLLISVGILSAITWHKYQLHLIDEEKLRADRAKKASIVLIQAGLKAHKDWIAQGKPKLEEDDGISSESALAQQDDTNQVKLWHTLPKEKRESMLSLPNPTSKPSSLKN